MPPLNGNLYPNTWHMISVAYGSEPIPLNPRWLEEDLVSPAGTQSKHLMDDGFEMCNRGLGGSLVEIPAPSPDPGTCKGPCMTSNKYKSSILV